MADVSDVESAFSENLSSLVYPAGVPTPGTFPPSPLVNAPVRVLRGWPVAEVLDADMAAGRCQITVFPMQGMAKNLTRYNPQPQIFPGTANLIVSVNGQVVTFSGTGGAGQIAGIRVGGKFGTPYVVRLQSSDTPSTTASSLAALIPGSSVSGSSITLPPGAPPLARVSADATVYTEEQRQVQPIRVSCWCPTPTIRDTLCKQIASLFANGRWMPLSDGTSAKVVYRTEYVDDVPARAAVWRRDLVYDVEYGSGQSTTSPAILFGVVAGNTNTTVS